MKVKGIELFKMIKSGEIKNDTRIKVIYGSYNLIYIFRNYCLYDQNNKEMRVSVLLSEKDFEILEDKTEEIEEMTLNGRDIRFGSMRNWLGNCSLQEEKISSAIDSIGIKINELVRAYNSLIKQDTSKETNCMSD